MQQESCEQLLASTWIENHTCCQQIPRSGCVIICLMYITLSREIIACINVVIWRLPLQCTIVDFVFLHDSRMPGNKYYANC